VQNKKMRATKKKKTKVSNPIWYILSKRPLDKIKAYISQFDAIKAAVGSAPHSVDDWETKMQAGMSSGKGAPHLNGKYMKSWHIRSFMLSNMKRDGVSTLTVDETTSLNAFLNMNPDAKGNLKRLRSHFECSGAKHRALTVKQFLKLCHTRRPELLSMWCCLALDSGFKDNDFDRFSNSKWQKASKDYYETTQLNPHPAVTNLASSYTLKFRNLDIHI
jgi:hypothetical protein